MRSLLIPIVLLLASSACASQRFVSQTHWSGPDTLYVAYNEVYGETTTPKIKRCTRAPDNRLQCVDELVVNSVLAK